MSTNTSKQQQLEQQEPVTPEQIVVIDGQLWSEAGEWLGEAPEGTEAELGVFEPGEKVPFIIDTQEKFEWAMRRLFEMDRDAAALDERLSSFTRNIDKMLGGVIARRKGFLRRFEQEIMEFCRQNGRGKTGIVECPYGKAAVTKAPVGAWTITDFEQAVKYVGQNHPGALKEKTVVDIGKSLLPEHWRKVLHYKGEGVSVNDSGMYYTEPIEKLKLDTGGSE